jgi:hypothetical protein
MGKFLLKFSLILHTVELSYGTEHIGRLALIYNR